MPSYSPTFNFNGELDEISLAGFQIVGSKFFGKAQGASMSLQMRGIVFNSAAVKELNNCEAIQMLVNEKQKSVLIKPISSHDGDAIIWNKGKDKQYSRLECTSFAMHLMNIWGYKENLKYIAKGRLVRVDHKVMMMFDFKDPIIFDGKKRIKEEYEDRN